MTALEAAGELHSTRPEDAESSIQRISRKLQRLAAESAAAELSAAADAMATARGSEVARAVQRTLLALRQTLEQPGAPRGTILITEDDPGLGLVLRRALEAEGWHPILVEEARQAMQVLEREQVAAVLLDLVLPDADGRNTLLAIKEHPATREIPVYVMSAKLGAHVESECVALGAAGFYRKPLNVREVGRELSARHSGAAGAAKRTSHV
ncbi:MAG: response regulator, partial [Gemmatimonadales bacterium]